MTTYIQGRQDQAHTHDNIQWNRRNFVAINTLEDMADFGY